MVKVITRYNKNFKYICETSKPNEIIVTYENSQGIRHTKEHFGVEVIQRESDIVSFLWNRGISKQLFEITMEWNADKLECDILVNEKSYKIWDISQMALGELLFESW